jgi:hypothetical protein
MNNTTKIISLTLLPVLFCACSAMSKKPSNQEKKEDFVPKLKRPEVRKVWVPDQIVGDEYVTGHWKYVLEKNAVWTKEN